MTGEMLGQYRILDKLGQGGMGVVYKALDTRLDRPVAIKVLPAEKVADPDRKRRFVQEAKAASALNHPNIITIYDIHSDRGHDYMAMEFVAGKTLDDLIPRNGMRLNELLRIATQIASGLVKAHAAGITHRDLKPSNVMVDGDGRVKILDFGLAKLTEPKDPGESGSTITQRPDTEQGVIMGTVSYMSPEQAEGRKVDARSDIFSFGVLLYEMITGQRAFVGETQAAILASVIARDPKPLTEIAAAVPHDLEKIVTRCLRKDRARRFQHMDDLAVALEEVKEESESGRLGSAVAGARPAARPAWIWAAAAFGLAVVAGGTAWMMRAKPEPMAPTRDLRITPLTSYPGVEGNPAFSPDATQVAFHWNGEKQDNFDIYVKVVGSGGPPLRLTNHAERDWAPEWSPDGKAIAFIRNPGPAGAVYLISPLGGSERKLCDTKGDALAWHPDSERLAIMDRTGPEQPYHLAMVNVSSGEKQPITKPSQDLIGDGPMAFSPDGKRIAFTRWRIPSGGDLIVRTLDGSIEKEIHPRHATLRIVWTPDGRDVLASSLGSSIRVHADGSGVVPGPRPRGHGLTVAGKPRPDGVVFVSAVDRVTDTNIWKMDIRPAGEPVQIAGSTREESSARWSPDATRIAFASTRTGVERTLWLAKADGSDLTEIVRGLGARSNGWSPDGKWIVFDGGRNSPTGPAADIYVVSADGGAARNVTASKSDDVRATFSRDGKSIYFRSDRSGRNEIWKIPFEGGQPRQITRNGGFDAHESSRGDLLYFVKESARDLKSRDLDKGGAPGGLWSIPVEGGEETLVLPSVSPSYWTITEAGLFYVDFSGPKGAWGSTPVQHYDFGTKKSTTVATIHNRLVTSTMNFTVSRDGRKMLWSQIDREEADIMLMEGWKP